MKGDYLGTYNGTMFYPTDTENIGDVDFESIAFSLSTNSRFCGHCSKFWSVAQHSLLVSRIIEEKLGENVRELKLDMDMAILLGLTHDMSEAYISDICRPVKVKLPDYLKFEETVQEKIESAFGLSQSEISAYRRVVSIADDTALYAEAMALMNPSTRWELDCKDNFEGTLANEYKNYICVENMQIVEATFIQKVMKKLNDLHIKAMAASHINRTIGQMKHMYGEAETRGMETGESDWVPVFRLGAVPVIFKESNGFYLFQRAGSSKNILVPKSLANNAMDIFKLIDILQLSGM